jgi:hypothetical protein
VTDLDTLEWTDHALVRLRQRGACGPPDLVTTRADVYRWQRHPAVGCLEQRRYVPVWDGARELYLVLGWDGRRCLLVVATVVDDVPDGCAPPPGLGDAAHEGAA